MYRRLDSEKTIATIETLSRRIETRFPGSGLSAVCRELCDTAHASKARVEVIARPHIVLRVCVGVVVVLMLAVLFYSISQMDLRFRSLSAGELVQVAEAALNEVVLIGAALFFLVTVEVRLKRARALGALHELRSLAHVIDMHQLTKDPARLDKRFIVTSVSPPSTLSADELMRYLDYCSEMLSLTGKVAALYAQHFRDSVVLSAVNELEALTTGLSRKIWQKIMILHKWEAGVVYGD